MRHPLKPAWPGCEGDSSGASSSSHALGRGKIDPWRRDGCDQPFGVRASFPNARRQGAGSVPNLSDTACSVSRPTWPTPPQRGLRRTRLRRPDAAGPICGSQALRGGQLGNRHGNGRLDQGQTDQIGKDSASARRQQPLRHRRNRERLPPARSRPIPGRPHRRPNEPGRPGHRQ